LVLPIALLQSLQKVQGFNENAFVLAHQKARSITSIRKNPAKIPDIVKQGVEIPWCKNGLYLKERPSFTLDPTFHAGAYYVQEASSMFLEEVLKQTVNLSTSLKILDLCAAPGGKSTLIQSVITADSLLVSNEVIKTRVTVLKENIVKWGAANVVITHNDPADFKKLPCYFDVIVTDAPCSGSGLFRKDANAIEEWSENNVQLCSRRQQRILADVLPALKDNGILIYSTCSYSAEENEAIADWLMEAFKLKSVPLNIPAEWNIIESRTPKHNGYGYRFYPDKVQGEGFFIAAFINTQADTEKLGGSRQKVTTEKVTASEIAVLKPWLKNAEDFFFIKQQEDIIILPVQLQQELLQLQTALYIKKAGIKAGAVIRDELIPDHQLAVSGLLHPSVAVIETDLDTALQYLRRQEITIATPLKGWALLSHGKLPLGWVKILPSRINNYYPKEWRIINK
jgi:16S rRNA C967 or C1407 C5-methylase (RsmB/RsmF family)/NOL1/NOP2/fmu family ribosome biogenesis protein